MPNVIVLEGGMLRRCLNPDGAALMNGISTLTERPHRAPYNNSTKI